MCGKKVRSFGTRRFVEAVVSFSGEFGRLADAYDKRREQTQHKLELSDGLSLRLSPGKHNVLQIAVIELFRPRFAPGAQLLYFGDTAKKHLVCLTEEFAKLKITVTEHDKLPDVVLFQPDKNWLCLIEAVTSHGPVSPKRQAELEKMLVGCVPERVYVTAFQTKADFRRYAAHIAWETEVWIAETPDHMIHFNGEKYLGPH